MDREALSRAYRATTYRVQTGTDSFDLRVGSASAALVATLAAEKQACFALISAENPRSGIFRDQENRRCTKALQDLLTTEGLPHFAARNIADQGDWPVELSFLVLGCSIESAMRIGHRFEQAAILTGGADGRPELCWLVPAI